MWVESTLQSSVLEMWSKWEAGCSYNSETSIDFYFSGNNEAVLSSLLLPWLKKRLCSSKSGPSCVSAASAAPERRKLVHFLLSFFSSCSLRNASRRPSAHLFQPANQHRNTREWVGHRKKREGEPQRSDKSRRDVSRVSETPGEVKLRDNRSVQLEWGGEEQLLPWCFLSEVVISGFGAKHVLWGDGIRRTEALSNWVH